MTLKIVRNFVSMFVILAMCGVCSATSGGIIQWNALGIENEKITNATIEVLSAGVRVASGAASSSSGPNTVLFDSSSLRGVDSPVTLRFRAVGREQVLLTNIVGDSNQVISVVLPKVYGAPTQTIPNCKQSYSHRCRLLRRCR